MGDDKDWQKQLMTAALMAAARTAVQYVTNPNSRDEAVEDVKSRLAEVDYSSAAKAVSVVIDRVAESAKAALNEAIDSIRENAEDAVEAAAEKAQEQLGSPRKRGKGRMFFGILLGIALGFVLLNEERRNMVMDKLTGASGPIDGSQWSTVATNVQSTASHAVEKATEVASNAAQAAAGVAHSASAAAESVSDAADSAANTADKVADASTTAAETSADGADSKSKKSKTAAEDSKPADA